MKVLIVTDRPDWSYAQIAQALVRHNHDPNLHIDVMALKGNVTEFLQREKMYSRVLLMGHQLLASLPRRFLRTFIDKERWLTGIHSAHAFDPDLKTTPAEDFPPPPTLVKLLKRFRGVNAVSQRLTDLFSAHGLNVSYTPNGVDTEVFKAFFPISFGQFGKFSVMPSGKIDVSTADAMSGLVQYLCEHQDNVPLRVGVAYSSRHDKRKGVSEFIRPACKRAGAMLVEAKSRSDKHVKPEDMPAWYRTLSVYCCMSSSEGASIAVLEAAASGIPVVSTRVGGSTELIRDGTDGLLIDRSVDALVCALQKLDRDRELLQSFGSCIRHRIEERFSWERVAPTWLDFLRS